MPDPSGPATAATYGRPRRLRGGWRPTIRKNTEELTSPPMRHTIVLALNVAAGLVSGYWKRPDATREAIDAAGWFFTGDIARIDEDGYYFIVDRKKDMIIRGGYNVYPREIEEVLYEHPAVREAAVIGIPHDQLGEEVGAVVALVEGEGVDPAALRDFVKERVAAYTYPCQIWIADELPKGPTGKIAKREIVLPVQ